MEQAIVARLIVIAVVASVVAVESQSLKRRDKIDQHVGRVGKGLTP